MEEKEPVLTIGFELTDEFGNHYKSESSAEVFTSLGETDLDFIGDQLNAFLKQCGYSRKNDHIFMEDVTEDEYIALDDYLSELRKENEPDDN